MTFGRRMHPQKIRRLGGIVALSILVFGAGLRAADGDLRLVLAAKKQDWPSVRALLKAGVDVKAAPAGADGATALHWAVYWDNMEIATALLGVGAPVNAVNEYGVTPLLLACQGGSAAMVKQLLQSGANPSLALPTGETPLMTAARAGAAEVVTALLSAGAAVNSAETAKSQTALMWAVSERHIDVVRRLLEHGADVGAKSKTGFTAFMFAAREGDLDMSRLLLDAGAKVNEAASDGLTPILIATVWGHTPLVKFLLDRGADPNASGFGYTALDFAAGEWGSELTGPRGIKVPYEAATSKSASEDAYQWSVMNGLRGAAKLEMVKVLLAGGADPNARLVKNPRRIGFDKFGEPQPGVQWPRQLALYTGATPFYLAALSADVPVMEALLAAGADPQLTTKLGSTPLMAVAGYGRYDDQTYVTEQETLDSARFLLKLGADVNAVNSQGDTALHAAAVNKLNALVTLLVEAGAKLDVTNKRGETPVRLGDTFPCYACVDVIRRTSTGDLLRKLGAREP